jgi:hypothetical protein
MRKGEVKHMNEGGERKVKKEAEEVREILGVVSAEVPALIKSLLSSVFSEEAGKSMGKAAAAYYKELKDGGLPAQVTVKLTEDYLRTFTSIGDLLRGSVMGSAQIGNVEEAFSGEIEKRIREKLAKTSGKTQAEEKG